MLPLAAVRDRERVSSIVQRFESARAADDSANLSDFVLPESDPLQIPVLIELIRFDRTWHRRKGVEKSLEEYRRDFPTLIDDPDARRLLSEDDTRHTPQESVPPECSSAPVWHPSTGRMIDRRIPAPFRLAGQPVEMDCSLPQSAESAGDLIEAAGLYRRFRDSDPVADERVLTSLFASAGLRDETVDLFCDIHRSSPEFADRLARATLSLPAPGREFFGFYLVRQIGRGAFGRVFLARQKDLADRNVVLKVTVELRGESHTLAQLQHTNIVPIYSVHTHDPFMALCMPFLGTTTLADVVASLHSGATLPASGKHLVTAVGMRRKAVGTADSANGAQASTTSAATELPAKADASDRRCEPALAALEGLSYVNAVLWIGARLADGLDHAHRRGILHRDLKPANVLLTDDGQPMLLDFNLSEDTKLRSSASVARAGGTLPYMSPEQIEAFRDGRTLDERSDLYSLGLILYELLTGRHAFPLHQGTAAEVAAKYLADRTSLRPRLRCHNGQISPAAEAIVLRCLEPDPARRYRSAQQVREDIERHLADLPLRHAAEPSWRERAGKWGRRHPRLTSTTSVALCCAGVIAMLAGALQVHRHKSRQLEAVNRLAGFREQLDSAKFLLYRSAPEGQPLAEGAGQASAALDHYGILSGARLNDSPDVRDLLSADDREELRAEVYDALLLLTRAAILQAQQSRDPAQTRERAEFGLRLLDLAESNRRDSEPAKIEILQRSELNRLLGNAAAARKQMQEADSVPARTPDELYLLALRLGDRRELARALPLLEESTRLDPHNLWAWFYQGFCHQDAGQDNEAIHCYTASIALARGREAAYLPLFNRGLAYARLGQFDRATADFDAAVRLRPFSIDALLNRGIARLDSGKFAAALVDFDEVLRREPAHTRAWFLRAQTKEKSGDAEGARQDRTAAMRAPPADELGWIERALDRVEKDPQAALEDLDHALELNPTCLLALQNKAHILGERLGRQQDAVNVLSKIVELYPGFVPGRIGRGVHLARLGRRSEAIDDAKESLERDGRPLTYYQAANIYALTSRQEPEDATESFRLLALALKQGFGLDLVDSDVDFDPVRGRAEFRRLVEAARELNVVARQRGR